MGSVITSLDHSRLSRARFPPTLIVTMIDFALWWQVEARPIICSRDATSCSSPFP